MHTIPGRDNALSYDYCLFSRKHMSGINWQVSGLLHKYITYSCATARELHTVPCGCKGSRLFMDVPLTKYCNYFSVIQSMLITRITNTIALIAFLLTVPCIFGLIISSESGTGDKLIQLIQTFSFIGHTMLIICAVIALCLHINGKMELWNLLAIVIVAIVLPFALLAIFQIEQMTTRHHPDI